MGMELKEVWSSEDEEKFFELVKSSWGTVNRLKSLVARLSYAHVPEQGCYLDSWEERHDMTWAVFCCLHDAEHALDKLDYLIGDGMWGQPASMGDLTFDLSKMCARAGLRYEFFFGGKGPKDEPSKITAALENIVCHLMGIGCKVTCNPGDGPMFVIVFHDDVDFLVRLKECGVDYSRADSPNAPVSFAHFLEYGMNEEMHYFFKSGHDYFGQRDFRIHMGEDEVDFALSPYKGKLDIDQLEYYGSIGVKCRLNSFEPNTSLDLYKRVVEAFDAIEQTKRAVAQRNDETTVPFGAINYSMMWLWDKVCWCEREDIGEYLVSKGFPADEWEALRAEKASNESVNSETEIKDGRPYVKDGVAVVPDGVKVVRAFAFENLDFTSVDLPDSLEVIGCGAFARGGRLDGSCKAVIPKGVRSVDKGAFRGFGKIEVYDTIEPDAEPAKDGYAALWAKYEECTMGYESWATFANNRCEPAYGAYVGLIGADVRFDSPSSSPDYNRNLGWDDYEIVVRSAETDEVKYRVNMPFSPDGNGAAKCCLSAWGKNATFYFSTIDQAFDIYPDPKRKVKAAINRLMWPVDLSDEQYEVYRKYLSRSAREAVRIICRTGEIDVLKFMGELGILKSSNIDALIDVACPKVKALKSFGNKRVGEFLEDYCREHFPRKAKARAEAQAKAAAEETAKKQARREARAAKAKAKKEAEAKAKTE